MFWLNYLSDIRIIWLILRVSKSNILLFVNRDDLTSSFAIYSPLISFSFLTDLRLGTLCWVHQVGRLYQDEENSAKSLACCLTMLLAH